MLDQTLVCLVSNSRPIDDIVNHWDSNATPENKVASNAVDDMFADDILGSNSRGGDFTCFWNGKYRVNLLLRKLGLGLSSYKHQVFHEGKNASWAAKDSILKNKFDT